MADPFALNTGDPCFDPQQPVTVNGFLYVPAEQQLPCRKPVTKRLPRREGERG